MPAPVAELTARGLIDALAGIAGVRRLPPAPPLTAAVLVAQIEVAAVDAADESPMRRTWRQRQGGGALPLLLVGDDSLRHGCVVVLGPNDASTAIRVVEGGALYSALARVVTLSRLEATREIADELGRLDQSGIPGLRVRELLTLHTLDVRLRRDTARWSAAAEAVKTVPASGDWQAVLRGLGYELERRARMGYLLKTQDGRRVAVIHPKASVAELSRLDPDGRPPEGRLLNDCAQEGVDYGLLAHQSRLRLFDAAAVAGSAATGYLELDAASLRAADRPLLALLSLDHLAGGGLARLRSEAAAFGAGLKRRLDDTLRHTVLPTLGHVAGRWARAHGQDPADDATREELERAALTLVFRCLFLLYAESSGYLPVDNRSYRAASLSSLVAEAHETRSRLGERSTSLWDRLTLLVKAMRTGNPAWSVPAYNGDLFAREGFDGAATLERMEIADPQMATILVGVGLDAETGVGIDYSTLEVGNLGHIYEGLLSVSLSVADQPLRYDPKGDVYVPVSSGEAADVEAGDLLWQTHEGGRKGGGVYYTPSTLVRHLVRQTVRPAFAAHLDEVRATAATDPAAATARLLDFAVLDPACGSAHFLVVVVAELADQLVRFLADTPLPEVRAHLDRLRAGAIAAATIDDVALIRRLVLKQCVFGVDVSPMGAEVAKLSLWLTSFVPGLSLAYLGRNVIVGNSLIGVARPEAVLRSGTGSRARGGRRGRGGSEVSVADQVSWLEEPLARALADATAAVARVADSDDRTPDEVAQSETADAEARAATARLEGLFDMWTAEPLGGSGARHEIELHGADILAGWANGAVAAARSTAEEHHFLHWPLAFPRVFSRELPGFDAVVGNPPWEEVTVERLAFFAQFRPGLRALSEVPRECAISSLLAVRPELAGRLSSEQARVASEKAYFYSGEYPRMAGDPDLYKYFCQRYQQVLRSGGRMGVVLPRTAFVTKGSAGFQHWLFERMTCHRLDFLLNSGRWAFDAEPRNTVALVSAEDGAPPQGHAVVAAGTARSLPQWDAQMASHGLKLSSRAFGPDWAPALLRDQREADLLAKVRVGESIAFGAGWWKCFPLREFHETDDKSLWRGATDGWPLWKGESFDQYAPTGAGERLCRADEATMRKVRKQRPGEGSLVAERATLENRRDAVAKAVGQARVAFRDVARATDSRTVRACFVPPRTFLTNTAPYLAFVDGDERASATCLGVMNSLPFDWQARRFAEIHLNFFILEGLVVPDLDDDAYAAIATAAARLSCVDERFAEFAAATRVECGPLTDEERLALRVDIDARVAHAWQLTAADLETLFADFTVDAVTHTHRDLLRARLAELA